MSAKIKITLKKLKGTDHVYHRESGIILQSSDDRTAIGRYENDTPIYSLTRECIETCIKLRFNYDESLLEDEDGSEVDAEEEDPEQADNDDEGTEQVDGDDEGAEQADGDDEGTEQVDGDDEGTEQVDGDDEGTEQVEETENVDTIDDITTEQIHIESVKPEKSATKVTENIQTSYIRDITNEYSNKLYSTFDLLHLTYSQKISDYENKLVDYDSKFNKLQLEHDKTKTELENLKVKFQKLKSVLE